MKLKKKKNKKNKINGGHYVEVLDRLNMLTFIMETFLQNHPLIKKEKDIEKLVNYSIINLSEAYQRVGALTEKRENEKEGIKKVILRRREDSTDKWVGNCEAV